MSIFYFVSDLHGRSRRWHKLIDFLQERPPAVLLIGGDVLPGGNIGFIEDTLIPGFVSLQGKLGPLYPRVGVILGNDDPLPAEASVLAGEERGIWRYLHNRKWKCGTYSLYGYACVPPTPFLLKDWERYDVSRYVDPGSIAPEEGIHSDGVSEFELRLATIDKDLEKLGAGEILERAIFLFHAPPYSSNLDRAALNGHMVDHAPLDIRVGSIAVRRFIEQKQPLVTLHGHVHESARLTGSWRDLIGRTHAFSAAHDGPELALVIFDPDDLQPAQRLRL